MILAEHDPRRYPMRVPPARDGRTLPIAGCTLQNRRHIVPLDPGLSAAIAKRARRDVPRDLASTGHCRTGAPAGE